MILEMLVSALAPAAIDMVKGAGAAISRKWFGLSVDDQIKIDNAQVGKLEALAKLDSPVGTPSQWVVDLRASFRYISAAVLIIAGCSVLYTGYRPDVDDDSLIELGGNLMSMPFSFIFGERMWLGIKGVAK